MIKKLQHLNIAITSSKSLYIGLNSLRKGEAEVGLSEIRKSRIDACKPINSNSVGLGCA